MPQTGSVVVAGAPAGVVRVFGAGHLCGARLGPRERHDLRQNADRHLLGTHGPDVEPGGAAHLLDTAAAHAPGGEVLAHLAHAFRRDDHPQVVGPRGKELLDRVFVALTHGGHDCVQRGPGGTRGDLGRQIAIKLPDPITHGFAQPRHSVGDRRSAGHDQSGSGIHRIDMHFDLPFAATGHRYGDDVAAWFQ